MVLGLEGVIYFDGFNKFRFGKVVVVLKLSEF